MAVGDNRFGQLSLYSWDNIKQPICGAIYTTNEILALLDSLVTSGQVDPNTAGALAVKISGVLEAKTGTTADGKLKAFIKQINAQAGKKITTEAAAVLINAVYIMNHN